MESPQPRPSESSSPDPSPSEAASASVARRSKSHAAAPRSAASAEACVHSAASTPSAADSELALTRESTRPEAALTSRAMVRRLRLSPLPLPAALHCRLDRRAGLGRSTSQQAHPRAHLRGHGSVEFTRVVQTAIIMAGRARQTSTVGVVVSKARSHWRVAELHVSRVHIRRLLKRERLPRCVRGRTVAGRVCKPDAHAPQPQRQLEQQRRLGLCVSYPVRLRRGSLSTARREHRRVRRMPIGALEAGRRMRASRRRSLCRMLTAVPVAGFVEAAHSALRHSDSVVPDLVVAGMLVEATEDDEALCRRLQPDQRRRRRRGKRACTQRCHHLHFQGIAHYDSVLVRATGEQRPLQQGLATSMLLMCCANGEKKSLPPESRPRHSHWCSHCLVRLCCESAALRASTSVRLWPRTSLTGVFGGAPRSRRQRQSRDACSSARLTSSPASSQSCARAAASSETSFDAPGAPSASAGSAAACGAVKTCCTDRQPWRLSRCGSKPNATPEGSRAAASALWQRASEERRESAWIDEFRNVKWSMRRSVWLIRGCWQTAAPSSLSHAGADSRPTRLPSDRLSCDSAKQRAGAAWCALACSALRRSAARAQNEAAGAFAQAEARETKTRT
eukprot:1823656-Pleurochrysis_carterae.AAC.3